MSELDANCDLRNVSALDLWLQRDDEDEDDEDDDDIKEIEDEEDEEEEDDGYSE